MCIRDSLSLRFDPAYEKISRRFFENPDEFADAFAKAWFKLTHRDMGPKSRYLGPEVPVEDLIWQDPVPPATHELINKQDIEELKNKILNSGLSVAQLVTTAWALSLIHIYGCLDRCRIKECFAIQNSLIRFTVSTK